MTLRDDGPLIRFAARHHGLYRSSDARALGYSDHQIATRVRRGVSERMGRGVYRIAGVPCSRAQGLLAGVWRTGGVVSHRSAALSLGLLELRERLPEVVVARTGSHDHHGLIVHRSSDLGRSVVVDVDGVPTTGPARTIADLGQVVARPQVERAVHRALHLGLLRLDDLVEEYRRLSRPGRRGSGALGAVLREMDPDSAPAESALELLILRLIRRAGLPEPVLQHEVEVGSRRYRLDMAYPGPRVFVEGDGFGVHGRRDAFESDRVRQNALVLAGWRPLRFTWRQARTRPEEVVRQVAAAVGVRGG